MKARYLLPNKSGYRGVSLATKRYTGTHGDGSVSAYVRKYWKCQIYYDGKLRCLGYFDDVKIAAETYDTWAKKYHEKPLLNIV